ncbi:DUF4347 domain-containing protein [Flavivirga spongiicola]|uniref:DUF4347 domain-containing protein n=1 Tax=Flavivirga spongiicola TaxID=421621 RepID=A0ABU7XZ60_9FLAO|nr:DUF4347 domain-containing protein [Flavivirga sp. MEBiC05379]MDO5980221.1 DUF4347 domain-containing protein [Flavivirga sp. MEBiC05379]
MKSKPNQITFAIMLLFMLTGTAMFSQQKNLIVIDKNYPNKQSLIASVPKSDVILQISLADNLWGDIYASLIKDTKINNIHLFLKTVENKYLIGNTEIGVEALKNNLDLGKLGTIKSSGQEKNLYVYSCSLANNTEGIKLLETLGMKAKFNVISAKGCTSIFDGNFNFNYSSKGRITHTDLILD